MNQRRKEEIRKYFCTNENKTQLIKLVKRKVREAQRGGITKKHALSGL